MDASALASAEYWLSVIAIAKLAAAFLVAAGVAIEFGGDWIARPFERTVNEAREAQLAALTAEAETAKSVSAKANAVAATARLEQEQLKARVKWRTLDNNQQAALTTTLQAAPGTAIIEYTMGDPESLYLALQLGKCFQDARWNISMLSVEYQGALVVIPTILGSDNDQLNATITAFTRAQIVFSRKPIEYSAIAHGGSLPSHPDVKIVVGSRPQIFE